RVVAFTGAGISAESGLGTFRGRDGLWSRYDPAEVASIESFKRDPRKFWKFAREIGWIFLNAKPNAAHMALAELEAMKRLDSVITQNVDGLHQRAGSKHVVEIHGNVGRMICTRCSASCATEKIINRIEREDVPTCERCGGPLKPDIILFGEPLPERAFEQALKKVRSADLLLAVGTSLEVYPAATLPEIAKKNGAKVVSIDSERTAWDDLCDYKVNGPAGQILPRIVQAIKITL
ncbi:MAG TPA: NAD-dependent deacylase, partial [Candidatus Acidoferrum sp.]|nr:NAD-dependent deacylase [Candidatus Acidoferrum sp.]